MTYLVCLVICVCVEKNKGDSHAPPLRPIWITNWLANQNATTFWCSANENAGFPDTTKKSHVTEVCHNADEALLVSLHTHGVEDYLQCKGEFGMANFLLILPRVPYSRVASHSPPPRNEKLDSTWHFEFWLPKNTPSLMKSWLELATLNFNYPRIPPWKWKVGQKLALWVLTTQG